MKYTSGFFLFILLWTACKKAELPPTSFDDPVFSVTYFADTISAQTVTAGKDDIYLFTDFDASDFVVCSGSFSEVDCPNGNCPGSLTFEFKSLTTDPFAPDTVLHLGNYQFLGPDSTGSLIYHTVFNAVNSGGYNSFSWKINDQNAGTGPTIEVDFPDISVTPKTIELTAQKTPALQSTIRRKISLTNPGGNQFPGLNINATLDSIFNFRLEAETSGPPYDTLVWNTGDSNNIIFQNFLLPFYSVVSSDSAGNPAFAAFDELTVNDLPVRTANFTYTVEQIIIPAAPGEVSIRWVDPQGILWRSDEEPQDASAYFIVSESEPYKMNEKGQKTRKMRVDFYCQLFNDAGEGRFFSGSGVIAVAYP